MAEGREAGAAGHTAAVNKKRRAMSSERIVKGTMTELNFICFFVYSVHLACSC